MKFTFLMCLGLIPIAAVQAQIDIQLEPFVNGVQQPVLVTHAGDGSGRIFVVERQGKIRVIDPEGNLLPTPFLDVGAGGLNRIDIGFSEQGLLGLAFHPDFENNGRFFLNYTRTDDDTIVSEWRVSPDPNVAYATSEQVILGPIDQPNVNHNGGSLAFGPTDGMLYISLGDGGSGNDPWGPIGNGQNTNTLLGSILRIDVDSSFPYAVPADNPFVGMSGFLPEIYAYGFRNPWRMAFDMGGDHRLFAADVGQDAREEVSIVESGKNYGWRCFEGTLDLFFTSGNCGPATVFEPPVAEYSQSAQRCSITGGYVYRGWRWPTLDGIYFFADYCSGEIFSLTETSPGVFAQTMELDASFNISAFGQDEEGEVYVCAYNQANPSAFTSIHRLIDVNAPMAPNIAPVTTEVAFGSRTVGTTSGALAATVTNTGNADLSFSSVEITGADADQFESDASPNLADLAPQTSREFRIRFAPTSPGEKSAELAIESNDPDEPTLQILLTGTGVEGSASVSTWMLY